MKTEDIVKIAVKALDNKKAINISALDISELTVLCDSFVIASATSSTHVHALADEVQEKLKESGAEPEHTEGRTTGWIVLDYGSVIVHIFTPKEREFYALDKVWSDGRKIDIQNIIETFEEEKI